MKQVLFLTYDLPYPLDAGGKIRSYHLIKQLSKQYRISLLYFYREKQHADHEEKMRKYCADIIAVPRRPVMSMKTLSYLPQMPYPAALYYDPAVAQTIAGKIADGMDILHAESFYTSMYVSPAYTIPQILGTENIEWHVYQEYAKQDKNFLLSPAYQFEINRIKKYEIATWQIPDRIIAVSDENQKEIMSETNRPVSIVRNGVDIDFFAETDRSNKMKSILFVGNFAYIQNTDAISYLLTDIAPLLPREYDIHIVGRHADADIRQLMRTTEKKYGIRVRLDEKVDDIRDAFAHAYCLIAPLRTGSGTKFKILESMASGIPVITTAIGAEGLNVSDGKELLIAESPEEFRTKLHELEEEKMYDALVAQGKKLVARTFSWDAIGTDIVHTYEETLDHHR